MTSRSRLALASLLVALILASPVVLRADDPALPADLLESAAALRDAALAESDAFSILESLTVEVGARFAGSPADRRAVAWAKRNLEALGFENVRTEAVTVPRWERGTVAAEILAPYPQRLIGVIALGGSVPTPDGGIETRVLGFPSLEALEQADPAEVEGRIVFIHDRMDDTRDGSGYGRAVGKRVNGPAVAAELGAVALLIRSAGTDNNRLAHTGTTRYKDGVPRIPAAALSNPDADMLEAQLASGEPVRVGLEITSRYLPDTVSANVIGEVIGREKPEEIVLLAAHLDSWDVGTGAHDDGAGCAILMEVGRRLAALEQAPRRTVRVVLYANEEFGLSGGRAYGEAYADAVDQHIVAIESDLGGEPVWRFSTWVAPEAVPVAEAIAGLLEPLGIEWAGNVGAGGADISPLRPHRVPMASLPQDAHLYFQLHHTENDTLDKVDPVALRQNVAAYLTFTYLAAEMQGDFGRAPENPPPRH